MIDIETTYKEFGPMVYRRCLQLLGDEAQATEAMQDVFVKLMSVDEVSAPSSLLYIMATRHCLNLLRSKKRRPEDASGDLVYEIASARDFEETSKARMRGEGGGKATLLKEPGHVFHYEYFSGLSTKDGLYFSAETFTGASPKKPGPGVLAGFSSDEERALVPAKVHVWKPIKAPKTPRLKLGF